MRNKALIVEDIPFNRMLLSDILEDDFEILEAEDGEEALAMIESHKHELAVILLDLVMPNLDGFGVLQVLNERKLLDKIPVLIISGETEEAERKCFDYGISDFIRKPFDARIVKKRVKNNAELFMYKEHLEEKVDEQTEALKEQNIMLRNQAADLDKQNDKLTHQAELLVNQAQRLRKVNEDIIEAIGNIVEARNDESGFHIQRVKKYTEILGKKFLELYPDAGLTEEDLHIIVAASPLHDVGKIMIPDAILLKPGKLTKEEFDVIKTHPTLGAQLIEQKEGMWDEMYFNRIKEIAGSHHERYDGRGYPQGLKGEEIPLSAQLVSVADVYDALVNERPYKKAFSKEKTFEMITNGECGAFSPRMMECFKAARAEMEIFADGE